MQNDKEHNPEIPPEKIRISLDTLIELSNSYYNATSDALIQNPDDENVRALAIFVENTRFYLEMLKKQITFLSQIQSILSTYQLKKAQTDAVRQ